MTVEDVIVRTIKGQFNEKKWQKSKEETKDLQAQLQEMSKYKEVEIDKVYKKKR